MAAFSKRESPTPWLLYLSRSLKLETLLGLLLFLELASPPMLPLLFTLLSWCMRTTFFFFAMLRFFSEFCLWMRFPWPLPSKPWILLHCWERWEGLSDPWELFLSKVEPSLFESSKKACWDWILLRNSFALCWWDGFPEALAGLDRYLESFWFYKGPWLGL